jgi:hypothetical protein
MHVHPAFFWPFYRARDILTRLDGSLVCAGR